MKKQEIPPHLLKYFRRSGVKPKDDCLVPERFIIAAQERGWYIRSKIIWAKPNPMPESCTDRPTDAYEHIFLMTKAKNYWYDAEAVREPHKDFHKVEIEIARQRRLRQNNSHLKTGDELTNHSTKWRGENPSANPSGRNLRNVWTWPKPVYRLRADISDADRLYVLNQLGQRGLLASKPGTSDGQQK